MILSSRSTRSGFFSSIEALHDFKKFQDHGFVFDKTHQFMDFKDVSKEPSYTDFQIPYHILCQQRFTKKKSEMEEQFQKELNQLLRYMDSAYEAARFMRHMCITTFWPPLHNRSEIQRSQGNFFGLNKRQKKHLHYLMATKIL